MERLILAVVLVIVAVIVAGVVQRRRPDAPTQSRNALIPQQLDRADFASPGVDWLVVLFSSNTCNACAEVLVTAKSLEADDVVVQEVTWQAAPDVQERYAIDTVPMLVIAGRDGAVGAGFVGTPLTSEVFAAMSSLKDREPS